MIPADVLRALRNDLPMPVTIRYLGRDGPYGKMSEGFFRFVCPYCHEVRATVNPRNNLAHCFSCQRNINNIDLLLSLGYDFKEAVRTLRLWLKKFKEGADGSVPSENQIKKLRPDHRNRPMKLAEILSNFPDNLGK